MALLPPAAVVGTHIAGRVDTDRLQNAFTVLALAVYTAGRSAFALT
jgi:hypothetical protein